MKNILTAIVILILIGAVNALEIHTDKPDYTPESTVTITGTGFNPGAIITCTVTRPGETEKHSVTVEYNGIGGFTATYDLDGVQGTYLVEASEPDNVNYIRETFTDRVDPVPEPTLAIAAVMALAPVIAYGLVRRKIKN